MAGAVTVGLLLVSRRLGAVSAAAALLLTGLGRVAGISGIFAGLLQPFAAENGWRWAFFLGLLFSPWLLRTLRPGQPAFPDADITAPGQWLLLLVAGVLVGYGTRMANGCTSGHGVCGLARLSPRSLVAVLVFMGSAMLRMLRGMLPLEKSFFF